MEPNSPSHSTGSTSKQSVDAHLLPILPCLANPGVRIL